MPVVMVLSMPPVGLGQSEQNNLEDSSLLTVSLSPSQGSRAISSSSNQHLSTPTQGNSGSGKSEGVFLKWKQVMPARPPLETQSKLLVSSYHVL